MPDRGAEVVVITGASAGIGRVMHAMATLFAPFADIAHAIKGFTQALRTELEHDRSKVRRLIVDMPGVNTPRFEWRKTTLHRHPKPTVRTSCAHRCQVPSQLGLGLGLYGLTKRTKGGKDEQDRR